MADKPALRATLEALKELKAEYYIGSQNAFNYLKAMRWYESLCQSAIAADPNDPIRRRLTPNRVGQIMDLLLALIHETLNLISVQASTPADWSLEADHYVYLPITPASNRIGVDEYKATYVWSFDCEWALDACARQSRDLREMSTVRLLLDELQGDVISLLTLLLGETSADAAFLIFEATGERVSFKQFKMQPRFRLASSKGWKDEFDYHLSHPEAREEDELRLLSQALADNDAVAAHDALQLINVRQQMASLESMVDEHEGWKTESVSAEEWLYDDHLWQRASCELALGRLEIERRIALNAVHSYQADSRQFSSTAHFVDWLIDEFKWRLRKSQAALARDRERHGLHIILEESEELVQKYRYTMLALRQNRKWLIEFLSR